MASRVSLLICLGGLLLVVASLVWPHLIGGRQAWSQEEAAAHSRAMVKLHGFTLKRDRGPADATTEEDAELAAARKEFTRGQRALDAARDRGQTTATIFRWLGIFGVLGGGAAYLVGRR